MAYTRRVQPRSFNDFGAAEVSALIEQAQYLAEPFVSNLDSGFAPESAVICD
jgi:hypothetical protein